jgi:hypothetical protein
MSPDEKTSGASAYEMGFENVPAPLIADSVRAIPTIAAMPTAMIGRL